MKYVEQLRHLVTAAAAVGLFLCGFFLGVTQPKESATNSLMLRRVLYYVNPDQSAVECLVNADEVIVSCDSSAYTTKTPVVELCSVEYCQALLQRDSKSERGKPTRSKRRGR